MSFILTCDRIDHPLFNSFPPFLIGHNKNLFYRNLSSFCQTKLYFNFFVFFLFWHEKRSLGSVLENELMLWFFVCLFSLSFLYTFFLLCSSQAIQTSMRNIWILCCNESLLHFLIFSFIVFFVCYRHLSFFFKYSLPLLRSSIIFKNVFSTWEIIE